MWYKSESLNIKIVIIKKFLLFKDITNSLGLYYHCAINDALFGVNNNLNLLSA